jgi:hypothetical protein
MICSWNDSKKGKGQTSADNEQEGVASSPHGFGALSRRSVSSKPIIAAVNGLAYGGGLEIVMNCDIVIASQDAKFALPEVKRGVVAAQGGAYSTSGEVLSFMLIGLCSHSPYSRYFRSSGGSTWPDRSQRAHSFCKSLHQNFSLLVNLCRPRKQEIGSDCKRVNGADNCSER